MKRLLHAISTPVFLFLSLSLLAQDRVVTGKVTDSKDGSPVAGASIQPKGARTGTSTAADGSFRVSVPAGTNTLVVSSAEFEKQEVDVTAKSTVNVSLKATAAGLTEVVVIGYGAARKRDLTGSVATIGEKDFNKGVISSPEQLIQGRTSGVTITPASGEPGAGISINIRGTSSIRSGNNPLFVVDGVPLDGGGTSGGMDMGFGSASARNPLTFINPNDIENITILKDASAAAIYGARGANGVILITTKTGKGKPSIQFSTTTSISKVSEKYDLLNAEDFAIGVTQAGGNGNDVTLNQGADTDWQDLILRTGISQNYNLSYGGSVAKTNYRASVSYFDQLGIIKNSGLKRITGRLNLTQKLLNDKLKFDLNYTGSIVKNSYAPTSDNAGFQGSLIGATIIADPAYKIYNDDGTFTQAGAGSSSLNPVAMLAYIDDKDKIARHLLNVSGSYEIIKGLVYKANFAYDNSVSERKTFVDPKLKGLTGTQNIRGKDVAAISSDNNSNGRGIIQNYKLNVLLIEHTLTYDKQFAHKQQVNVVGGFSYQKIKVDQWNDIRWGVQTPGVLVKDITSFKYSLPYQYGDTTKSELQSYFGRINYILKDKYYLTATLRVDGSSKFGSSHKYGSFPAFAAKWKLADEAFFANNSSLKTFFDEISLRANWGITGNQEFPAYASLSIGQYYFDGSKNAQYLGNPDLKWEQTTSSGIGIDYSILNGRIKGNVDYYTRDTKDLLFLADFPQPGSNNYQWVNLPGKVRNKGLEFGVNVQALNGRFRWDIAYNMTFMNNKVLDFGSNEVPTGNIDGQGLSGAYAQVIKNNYSLFTYKMPVFLGFDKDGRNNFAYGGADRLLGSALPTFNAGLTNSFTLGNWNLNFFLNAVTGFYVYNNTANAYFLKGSLKTGHNVTYDVVNSEEDGLNTGAVSTRFLEKGDFLRLSNASLGYTFQLNKKSVFKSLGVNFSGQNLLLITGYSGIDPEVNINKAKDNVPSRGIDYAAYPSARTFSFNLNARF